MPEVKQEYTGWRDDGLSRRHRSWGWDCPAVDIDFLMIEYDHAEPVALVEYKRETAPPQTIRGSKSYQALVSLGNRAGVPVFNVRYAKDYSTFWVTPLNAAAKEALPWRATFEERAYVDFLTQLRDQARARKETP